MSDNFPTVVFPKRQLLKSILAAALGHLDHPSNSARPSFQPAAPQEAKLTFGKLPLRKFDFWEVATGEIDNCYLEKCLRKNTEHQILID